MKNIFEIVNGTLMHTIYNMKTKAVIQEEKFCQNTENSKKKKNKLKTIYIIPKSICIEKTLTIPSISENEIKKIVSIQIMQLVPFQNNEFFIHHQVIDIKSNGYAEVLVFIINKTQLYQLFEKVIDKGFIPDAVFIRPSMLLEEINDNDTDHISNFIYLEDSYTEIGFFKKKQLLYSRYLIGKRETDNFELEYQKTIEYAKNLLQKPVSANPLLIDRTSNQNSNSEYFRNTKKISYNEINHYQYLNQTSKSFFLIPEIEELKKRKKTKLRIIRTSLIFCLFFLILILLYLNEESKLNNEIDHITQKIKSISYKAEKVEKMRRMIKIYNTYNNSTENKVLSILELHKIMPSSVTLTLLHFKNLNQINIKGVSKNGGIDIVGAMEKSSVFKNVTLKYQNKINNKKNEVEFQICSDLELT